MIKNILFEVLPIASYTLFPSVWQLVDATPKKTAVALLRQTSYRAIFVHFRKKWSAETCIVLSRKSFWDVNKDFWHQWRSLVITTLSARAIYRQIPVSYLQTKHTTTTSVHSGTIPVQFRHSSGAIPVQLRCNYHYLRASLLYRWTWFRSPNRCSKWFGFV